MKQGSQIIFLGAGHPIGSFFQLVSKPNIYPKLGFTVLFIAFRIFYFSLREPANSAKHDSCDLKLLPCHIEPISRGLNYEPLY